MKRFLIRLAIFTAFFLLVDKLFLVVRNTSPAREADRRLEHILEGRMKAQVLVFGSSRGARCIIAQRFMDTTGVSAYSLAYPGSDITFHEYLLRQTLETPGNQKPETVILVVDDSDELTPSKSLKFRFDRLYPLVRYPAVRKELVKHDEIKPVVSEVLVLCQLHKSNFLLQKRRFTSNDTILPCGSMPIAHQKATFDRKYDTTSYTYCPKDEIPEKIAAFTAFRNLCKEHGIRLIIAIPPNFRKTTTGFAQRLGQLTDGYGTVFMYDETRPEYRDPEHFFDSTHLRTAGAEIYTGELIRFLNPSNPR